MEQVREIVLDQIEPNPDQPRTVFGQDALEELARSIKATGGVLEPILVRPENGTGTFRIIAGERRWRASRLAGLDTIRCLVTDVDDEKMALLALAENMVREDLTVVEEGRYLRRLLDAGSFWARRWRDALRTVREGVGSAGRVPALPRVGGADALRPGRRGGAG